MKMLGLTGGFGAGKTTVLKMFKKSGACVLSSDAIVHNELKTNAVLKKKIKKNFGSEVFKKDEVERRCLAKKVFSSPGALKRLNALIHPLVARRILDAKKRCRSRVLVVEVPLLFEARFDRFFDATIGIAADLAAVRKRLLKSARFAPIDLKARSVHQLSWGKKVGRCDFVIDNTGSKKKTLVQVKSLMGLIKKEKQWKS